MSFTLIQQATPRLHRSELAVPGSNPSLFEKAAKGGADIIFLDLEDAVAPDDKEQARKNIIQGLNDHRLGHQDHVIRINGLDTHYAYRDVVDVLENCPRLDMILIPKVGVPQDVYAIDMLVTQIEQYKKREKRIGFELLIETALGMANVEAIAQGSKRARVDAASASPTMPPPRARAPWASARRIPDYGILADKDERQRARLSTGTTLWHYALSRMMVACRAYGLRPIDGPFGDFSDPDGYLAAAKRAAVLGFEGKWAIHPSPGRPRQPGVHAVRGRGDQGQAHRRGDGAGRQGRQGRGVPRRPPDRHRLDPPGEGIRSTRPPRWGCDLLAGRGLEFEGAALRRGPRRMVAYFFSTEAVRWRGRWRELFLIRAPFRFNFYRFLRATFARRAIPRVSTKISTHCSRSTFDRSL